MTTQGYLRSNTAQDYNSRVNFQSAVKAMVEGKRVYFLTWKDLSNKDRLATTPLGAGTLYVRQHVNSKGRLTATSLVTEAEMQTPDWMIAP